MDIKTVDVKMSKYGRDVYSNFASIYRALKADIGMSLTEEKRIEIAMELTKNIFLGHGLDRVADAINTLSKKL